MSCVRMTKCLCSVPEYLCVKSDQVFVQCAIISVCQKWPSVCVVCHNDCVSKWLIACAVCQNYKVLMSCARMTKCLCNVSEWLCQKWLSACAVCQNEMRDKCITSILNKAERYKMIEFLCTY